MSNKGRAKSAGDKSGKLLHLAQFRENTGVKENSVVVYCTILHVLRISSLDF